MKQETTHVEKTIRDVKKAAKEKTKAMEQFWVQQEHKARQAQWALGSLKRRGRTNLVEEGEEDKDTVEETRRKMQQLML